MSTYANLHAHQQYIEQKETWLANCCQWPGSCSCVEVLPQPASCLTIINTRQRGSASSSATKPLWPVAQPWPASIININSLTSNIVAKALEQVLFGPYPVYRIRFHYNISYAAFNCRPTGSTNLLCPAGSHHLPLMCTTFDFRWHFKESYICNW